MLARLHEAGVKMSEEIKEETGDQPLKDKTFVLTGALATMTRDQASNAIKKLGGKVSSDVSKNTTYVVVGDSPG